MAPSHRALALLFALSGMLGASCGLGSCAFSLGYGTGVVPGLLEQQGLDSRVSGTPTQVATVYLGATLALLLASVPQLSAAFGIYAGKSWARTASWLAAVGAIATCFPVGLAAIPLLWTTRDHARAPGTPANAPGPDGS